MLGTIIEQNGDGLLEESDMADVCMRLRGSPSLVFSRATSNVRCQPIPAEGCSGWEPPWAPEKGTAAKAKRKPKRHTTSDFNSREFRD